MGPFLYFSEKTVAVKALLGSKIWELYLHPLWDERHAVQASEFLKKTQAELSCGQRIKLYKTTLPH